MAAEVRPSPSTDAEPVANGPWKHEPQGGRVAQPLIAGLLSMLLHLGLLIGLAVWLVPSLPVHQAVSLISAGPWQRPEELLSQDLDRQVTPARVTAALVNGPTLANLDATGSVKIDAPLDASATLASPVQALAALTPATELLDTLAKTRGNSVRAAVDSGAQAVDRLTEELAQLLGRRRLLLVWCFDQSGSMRPDREEICRRIAKIYAELGLLGAARGDALLTAVSSFGKGFLVHTKKPTSDPAVIEQAIGEVPVDDSGVEMMCQAISSAMRTHRRWLGDGPSVPEPARAGRSKPDDELADLSERQMVVVLVTDETGERSDNQAFLEKVIDDARHIGARIYVMGREAPFGSPCEQLVWTDPQTQVRLPIFIDRGPETAQLEVLQFDGAGRRMDFLPSGFGPYDQVRLARESGGLFFLLPGKELGQRAKEARDAYLARLRHYLPELESRADYVRARTQSPMRRAVWDVVCEFDTWDEGKVRQFTVVPTSLSVNPKGFVAQAAAAVAVARRLLPIFDRTIHALDRAQASRREESSRRWQANYDLMIAQLVSYRARANELLACLEPYTLDAPEVKNVHGEEKPTSYWRLAPTKKLNAPARSSSDVELATRLFARVIESHPETPWAWRAAAEMSRPYGLQLVEVYSPPIEPRPKVDKPNL
jgi:hypothetical protein